MVEISLSGSGEGPGWVTAPGYSTAAFLLRPISTLPTSRPVRPGGGGGDRGRREDTSVYSRDPDGNLIEFMTYPAAGRGRWEGDS